MNVSEQASQAHGAFNEWLGKHNADEWSFTKLPDAQKESLLWIGVSFVFAAALWKGYPSNYGQIQQYKVDEHGKNIKENHGPERWCWAIETVWIYAWYGRLNPLAPIKYLTVLYHEICHALVGFLSGGKPVLIIVDWNEGGATFFAPKSKHAQPSYTLTLPAGYIGSCAIGCAMIFCGFDTVASKYAAVGYGLMAVPSLLICMMILTKSSIRHNRHKWRMILSRCKGDNDRAAEHEAKNQKQEQEEKERSKTEDKKNQLVSDKTLMASVDAIIFTTCFTGAIFAVSWYLYDSLYLRFVILFLGTINALYSIWDIFLDGIKYGATACSDCTLMAARFNKKREKKVPVKTYATFWISVQLVLFFGSIVSGLYVWRDTLSEQALRSQNSLWATSSHYTPLGLAQSARQGAEGLLGAE